MIDLEDKYINFLKQTISKYLKDYELYLFGSRSNGTAKKYSDIDIAIKSGEMNDKIKSKLAFEFENSTLPFEVDVIDLNTTDSHFIELIKDDLTRL